MCGAYARSAAEWDAHPQQQATAAAGPVEIVRIGDGPDVRYPNALDVTRNTDRPAPATVDDHNFDDACDRCDGPLPGRR